MKNPDLCPENVDIKMVISRVTIFTVKISHIEFKTAC